MRPRLAMAGWMRVSACVGIVCMCLAAAAPPARASAPLTRADLLASERRLAELGYWTGPVDGQVDEVSRQALVAFQKVEGRRPSGRLTRDELTALRVAAPPAPLESGPPHFEVDLARQVLFFVSEGRVSHVLPISSGSGKPFTHRGWGRGDALTPCGRFTVFQRLSGWHKSPLGVMYNPLYLVGGIAIHGSPDVPPRPVSHGCIRVPMFASRRLPSLIPPDMPVVVYGCPPPPAGAVADALD
jgi:hypothetical protein